VAIYFPFNDHIPHLIADAISHNAPAIHHPIILRPAATLQTLRCGDRRCVSVQDVVHLPDLIIAEQLFPTRSRQRQQLWSVLF
jgi:hypothetical protein